MPYKSALFNSLHFMAKKASLEMFHFIKMNMPGNNNEYTTQPI